MFDRTKRFVPENFYPWMDVFFRILGLLPPKGMKKKILYTLIAILNISMSMVLVTSLEGLKLIREFEKDFKVSMLTLSLCTLHLVVIFRLVFWFFTRGKLEKVKKVIQRDSFEFNCFGIDSIEYKNIFERARCDERRGKVLKYADLKRLWNQAKITINSDENLIELFRKEKMTQTRMLCCCFYFGINFVTLFTIIASYANVLGTDKYEDFNTRRNITSTYRVYPYHIYFPFDTSVSHGFYWQGYLYQIYAYCTTMLLFLPVDTIIINSIIHVISQTIIVGKAFNHVGNNIDYSQGKEKILLLQEIRIVKCINELQDIFRSVYLLEDLCNVQMLIQYGASVFILCFLCYIIPLVDNVGELICSFIYLSATLGEIFIFTYCSQTLSLELQNVVNAVYALNWPEYPPKLRKNLVFLISRLQKPCVLTAGKIFNLDLLFFIQVTQKSYSFYTLISNTNK